MIEWRLREAQAVTNELKLSVPAIHVQMEYDSSLVNVWRLNFTKIKSQEITHRKFLAAIGCKSLFILLQNAVQGAPWEIQQSYWFTFDF